jgi:hypothetical protein
LPHPCSPDRGKPLDAPPCREAATRRALCSGDPAFEPCFSSVRGCSRESRPAAPQRAAATTSPWRCPTRRPSTSRRALRLDLLEAGHRVVVFFPAGLGGRKPRVERTPALRPRVAAPPNGHCSCGVAVSRRRTLRVAPSTPVGQFLAQGLPSRRRARRRPVHSHPSISKGRRRRSGSSPAQGRAAYLDPGHQPVSPYRVLTEPSGGMGLRCLPAHWSPAKARPAR